MAPFGLGAPAVDWYVEFDGGRPELVPGVGLRGTVRFTARQHLQVNRLGARMVGTEEYAYDETDYEDGSRTTNRQWGSKELLSQELTMLGPGLLAAGQLQAVPFTFSAPPSPSPSFESDVIRVRWKLTFWLDMSGLDPHIDVSIYVPLLASSLSPADPAMAVQFAGVEGGRPYSIWLQQPPLLAGAPFSGLIDATEQLDPGRTRLELRLDVVSSTDDGTGAVLLAQLGVLPLTHRHVSSSRVLWRAGLMPGPAGPGYWRYSFSGFVPNEPVVTAVLPHGGAKASLDLVISRPLIPDRHLARPVVIASR